MKKFFYIFFICLLLCSCESTEVEAEVESLENIVTPVLQDSSSEVLSQVDNEVVPVSIVENDENIISETQETSEKLNSNEIDSKDKNLNEQSSFWDKVMEDYKNDTLLLQSTLNFSEPDYIEFIPLAENSETEETLTQSSSAETPSSLETEETLTQSSSAEAPSSLETEETLSQSSPAETPSSLETEETLTQSSSTEAPSSLETEETFTQVPPAESLSSLETEETFTQSSSTEAPSSLAAEELPTQAPVLENLNYIEDQKEDLFQTEDIPLEEIFTPDENFLPLEPAETFTIDPSRTMDMKLNQVLIASYPGNGWIFLGDEYNSEIFVFDQRNIFDDNTQFKLKSKKTGQALLHFFKQDLLTNEIIDDYLLVNVKNIKGKLEEVYAPEYYYSSLDYSDEYIEDEIIEEVEDYDDFSFVQDEPELILFNNDPIYDSSIEFSSQETLDLANAFFDDELYFESLDQLNYYFDNVDKNDSLFDYALFIKGKLLESNSPLKNIKESMYCYKIIIDEFPESKYWDIAKQRITYLERFYFSVR